MSGPVARSGPRRARLRRTLAALTVAALVPSMGLTQAASRPAAASTGPSWSSTAPIPEPAAVTAPGASASAAGAPLPGTDPDDQPPPGATDGIPVGPATPGRGSPTEDGTTTPTGPQATPDAVTQRYFGDGPWAAIGAVARSTARCAGLGPHELRAMIVAPVFGESAGGTSPSSAPAPMTLSRYDEWTGTRNGDTNANGNYGLYAFRQPGTAYKRAFWHPGIGIWQYDSAGVGAGFTAAQRIRVGVVVRDVAAGMRYRWCHPAEWVSGDGPYTEADRRQAAWAPWRAGGSSCPGCEKAYRDMRPNDPAARFGNIHLVSMSAGGGISSRQCWLNGIGTLPCWRVDPQAAKGSNWWAYLQPLDGGSPTEAPTPISAPFYVYQRAGREHRVWLQADTGYAVGIAGSRQLGKNARPRSNQPGSGVDWRTNPGLCDVTANRGACAVNRPPPGVRNRAMADTITARPVAADVNGDGRDDLFMYGTGKAPDKLWISQGSNGFRRFSVSVGGDQAVTVADVNGDGRDDLVTYDPSSGYVRLWRYQGAGTLHRTVYRAWRGLQILAVDRSGTGRDDLLLYGAGTVPDQWWRFHGGQFARTDLAVNVAYEPHVGDFDGDGRQDLLWYAAGRTPDYIWYSTASGRSGVRLGPVNGRYQVVIGDYDGDGADDILWYAPGRAADSTWFGTAGRGFDRRPLNIQRTFAAMVVVNLPDNGGDDVLAFNPGGGIDRLRRWTAARATHNAAVRLDGRQTPVSGDFSGQGRSGVYWYGPGPMLDALWWQ